VGRRKIKIKTFLRKYLIQTEFLSFIYLFVRELNFKKEFLGLNGEMDAYHLHNYYIDFMNTNENSKVLMTASIQCVKRNNKPKISDF
jgi:hypothetical protein